MLAKNTKDPYKISHLTPKEQLYYLRKIFDRLNSFMRLCMPTTLSEKGSEEAFLEEKMNVQAELHDIHIKLSNLLLGKWERIQLIEFKVEK